MKSLRILLILLAIGAQSTVYCQDTTALNQNDTLKFTPSEVLVFIQTKRDLEDCQKASQKKDSIILNKEEENQIEQEKGAFFKKKAEESKKETKHLKGGLIGTGVGLGVIITIGVIRESVK